MATTFEKKMQEAIDSRLLPGAVLVAGDDQGRSSEFSSTRLVARYRPPITDSDKGNSAMKRPLATVLLKILRIQIRCSLMQQWCVFFFF